MGLTAVDVNSIRVTQFQSSLQSFKVDKICRVYRLGNAKHIVSNWNPSSELRIILNIIYSVEDKWKLFKFMINHEVSIV